MTDRMWKVPVKRTDTALLDGLEREVDRGACPGVINEGTQTIQTGEGPDDVHTAFFVTAQMWRTSVREAIDVYLDECESGRDLTNGEPNSEE
jgi:hypothetical protein